MDVAKLPETPFSGNFTKSLDGDGRSRSGASRSRVRLASRGAGRARNRSARIELVHQHCSEALKNPLIAPAAYDQDLGHESGIAGRECLNGVHQSRGSVAQRLDLFLIGFGVGQTHRTNFGSPGGAGLLNVRGLALGFLHPGLGFVGLDVYSDLCLGKVHLHVGGAPSLLRLDALVLGLSLHLECFHLLMRDLALRENSNQLFGVDDILDINSPGLDFVLREFSLDVAEGLFLDFLARLDERNRLHTANLVTKEVANGSLENLVNQVFHGTDHGNNAWSLCIRNVNENLQVDAEHEALIAFGNDGLKARIKPMSSCHVLRPIELENCRENELRVVNPGIDRVLPRSQRFFPDALVAGANQAAELEVCAGCVLRRQSYVGLDHGDRTLFHNPHRYLFHANQERVEVVSAIEQRVVLEGDLPGTPGETSQK